MTRAALIEALDKLPADFFKPSPLIEILMTDRSITWANPPGSVTDYTLDLGTKLVSKGRTTYYTDDLSWHFRPVVH